MPKEGLLKNEQKQVNCLVLIHGMGRLKWSMSHLKLFAPSFFNLTTNFSYTSRAKNIKEHGADFRIFLKELTIKTPNIKFFFITHSLGSLITLEALEDSSLDKYLAKAVFLGPPFKGSKFASKMTKFSILRKYFGTPFLELGSGQLNYKINPNLDSLVIAGILHPKFAIFPWFNEPNDSLVTLSETFLDGAHQRDSKVCLHAILMYHPSVIFKSFEFLTDERNKNNQ